MYLKPYYLFLSFCQVFWSKLFFDCFLPQSSESFGYLLQHNTHIDVYIHSGLHVFFMLRSWVKPTYLQAIKHLLTFVFVFSLLGLCKRPGAGAIYTLIYLLLTIYSHILAVYMSEI